MFELTVKFEIKHKEISVCIAFRLIVLFFNTAERERESKRERERERGVHCLEIVNCRIL